MFFLSCLVFGGSLPQFQYDPDDELLVVGRKWRDGGLRTLRLRGIERGAGLRTGGEGVYPSDVGPLFGVHQ